MWSIPWFNYYSAAVIAEWLLLHLSHCKIERLQYNASIPSRSSWFIVKRREGGSDRITVVNSNDVNNRQLIIDERGDLLAMVIVTLLLS